ncbi:hypothetical protein FA95DRAFT_1554255 [Auriscalpium vulgare]|uniref:Uncharacterized protein n=1 Tax=Auriscalpium vulgare TaxID=40419 RepID=A0ACB8S5F9_9AGAM|nr:hypothetical protein FA95DRAFT_1554255 [Auriscalpium vulgare]
MPKERRTRAYSHESSAKRSDKRRFAVQDNAVQHVDVGAELDAVANDLLRDADNDMPDSHILLKKKDKRQLKHELFIERLETSRSPYSKSHARRLKRKEKEQIGDGGMDGLKEALAAVQGGPVPNDNGAVDGADDGLHEAPAKPSRAGQIGEGKGAPLKKSQRKHALKAEQFRQPRIMANPDFAANPFKTIRTHAENTLVPHRSS